MNYREYWWKCTKDVLETFMFYLMIIGFFVLLIGGAIVLGCLGINFLEFLIPIFGEVYSFIIFAGLSFSGLGIIFLYFNYSNYKKYGKDGV